MVELLGTYSNLRGAENPLLSLIADARRCQTPSGNRNEQPLQNRVRRVPDDEVAEQVSAYQDGDSTYALARRFGIRRVTVTTHLERHGVERRANRCVQLDPATRGSILDLGKSQWPVRKIAVQLGLTERVVGRALDDAGVERSRLERSA
jgi:hypothetical protein